MDANFYSPQTAQAPGVDYAQMARLLMNRQAPQGQGATPTSGAMNGLSQVAGAAIPFLQQASQLDANKAATALNGGVATVGQTPAAFSRFGNALSSMFGG